MECSAVTRPVRRDESWGKVHEIEVTVYDWTMYLMINAMTKMPLAVNVRPSQPQPYRGGPHLVRPGLGVRR
jgi:hypothetical protein